MDLICYKEPEYFKHENNKKFVFDDNTCYTFLGWNDDEIKMYIPPSRILLY